MQIAPYPGWNSWTPHERAEIIRRHAMELNDHAVMCLFGLSAKGLRAIVGGYSWKPRYQANAQRERSP